MSESEQQIKRLWVVSELEQRIASQPDAKTLRELAENYEELGWPEGARRMRAQAPKLPAPELETQTRIDKLVAKAMGEGGEVVIEELELSGRFTPSSLGEILRVLHLTRKSGRLLVETVDGVAVTVIIHKGRLLEAQQTGGEGGEVALLLAVHTKGGRYQFYPGKPTPLALANLPKDSGVLIEAFTAEV
jgi:hypothetical protein